MQALTQTQTPQASWRDSRLRMESHPVLDKDVLSLIGDFLKDDTWHGLHAQWALSHLPEDEEEDEEKEERKEGSR